MYSSNTHCKDLNIARGLNQSSKLDILGKTILFSRFHDNSLDPRPRLWARLRDPHEPEGQPAHVGLQQAVVHLRAKTGPAAPQGLSQVRRLEGQPRKGKEAMDVPRTDRLTQDQC